MKRKESNLCLWCAVGLLLGCCLLAGCRIPPRLGVTDTGSPRYDRAMVVYELNGTQRPLPLSADEISPAGFEGRSPFEEPVPSAWASARLAIQYPHPDGDTEMARATLRLSSRPFEPADPMAEAQGKVFGLDLLSTRSFGTPENDTTIADASGTYPDDEIWVLDFPKQQLDLLLVDLAHGGFFEDQLRSASDARIDVQIDRGRTRKSWTSEPRLDHFVARVYREGRLGGFVSSSRPNG